MKNFSTILLVVVGLLLLGNIQAADNNENKDKKEKVSKPEANDRMNGDWYKYVDDAQKESKKTGKPILANFTGSDWCGWCIRLRNEVFNTDEFKKWAKENVVLLELDFPRRTPLPEDLKTQNSSMQQAFRVSGYPTIWIFDLSFNKDTKQYNITAIGKTGYVSGGPEKWIQSAEEIISQRKE